MTDRSLINLEMTLWKWQLHCRKNNFEECNYHEPKWPV